MTFKKVLIGLLAGITSGTFLGIHLTSDKSIETRRMVLGKGEHYLDCLFHLKSIPGFQFKSIPLLFRKQYLKKKGVPLSSSGLLAL
jgi:hypothetical protein